MEKVVTLRFRQAARIRDQLVGSSSYRGPEVTWRWLVIRATCAPSPRAESRVAAVQLIRCGPASWWPGWGYTATQHRSPRDPANGMLKSTTARLGPVEPPEVLDATPVPRQELVELAERAEGHKVRLLQAQGGSMKPNCIENGGTQRAFEAGPAQRTAGSIALATEDLGPRCSICRAPSPHRGSSTISHIQGSDAVASGVFVVA